MSQCVEREEEGSDRPESPTSSCVSMESDRSKGKPPEPGPSHTQPEKPTTDDEYWDCRGYCGTWHCRNRNTAEDLRCRASNCTMTKILSTSLDSITALPLSAADMRKSWHKDITQGDCDDYVRFLVSTTGDPAEYINLVTDAQNIERNMYESANSQEEYCELMHEKWSELKKKREKRREMKQSGQMDRDDSEELYQEKVDMEQSGQMEMKSMDQTSTPPLPPGDKLHQASTSTRTPPDFTNEPGPSHTKLFSITALPLSAADMRKSWHKDFPQYLRNFNVQEIVEDMSTGDPAENIKELQTDAQNIEREAYESANSKEEYEHLVSEKISEMMKKSQLSREKQKQFRKKRMKSMDKKTTPPLPLGVKKEDASGDGCKDGPVDTSSSSSSPYLSMSEDDEEEDEGSTPLSVDNPVTESQSSPHPSLELQDETDLSSYFNGLRIEETISLPRFHSLPSLSQIPCLENETSFTAKRSFSVNDVTLLDKTQRITPDIIVAENKESYRFHCTQAGLFQCNVTDLVFKMKTEGDVTYRTVHWDRRLPSQISKRAAGPLFDIKGSQGSVCQLHFPHCEILSMGGGKSLSVLHVMDDDGFELIKPHMITETHVIINVTGLSLFGIISYVQEKVFGPSPVQALVSLFYTPPIDDDPSSILNVLLLPGNVARHDMLKERRSIREEIYIEMPQCELIPKQEYTLSTSTQDDSIIILPDKSKFKVDALSYHNYNATFVMNLEERFENVTLLLSNSKTSICAWKGYVKLSAAALRKQQVQHTLSRPAEDRLFGVRNSFISSVSDPVLNGVLDKLFQKGVIIREEYDNANVKQVTQDKARFVIDAVRNKGTAASSSMILFLCKTDPFLSKHLGLM